MHFVLNFFPEYVTKSQELITVGSG